MSLQERTLVVKNFDPEKTNSRILKELCLQGGPVRNVVVRPDHAFVEYEDAESVGYSKALLDGISLFGRKLIMEPKLSRDQSYRKYTDILHEYIKYDKHQQELQRQQQQQILLYNQQAQMAAQYPFQSFSDLNLQQPITYYPTINQHMQHNNVFLPQNQFNCPDQTTGSMPGYNNNQLGRSRSFNHHQQPKSRNRSGRASDNRRR